MAEYGRHRYFNKNNGALVEYPRPNHRLVHLDNWVTVESDDHLARLRSEIEGGSARSRLLGAPGVGDRQPDPAPISDLDSDPAPISDPDPALGPDPEPTGPDPAARPARSATKSDWIDWAVTCGADRSEAEALTKGDLIEIYGE